MRKVAVMIVPAEIAIKKILDKKIAKKDVNFAFVLVTLWGMLDFEVKGWPKSRRDIVVALHHAKKKAFRFGCGVACRY
jgi:hypothetical protein